MPTTWAGTASNQAVTRQALQDALDNNIFNWFSTFIPSAEITKCVNGFDARTYVNINVPSGVSNNELMIKSDFVVPTGYENGTGIASRRDGANVIIDVASSVGGGISGIFVTTSTCTPSTIFSNTAGTLTITVRNGSSQNIKFWLQDGGTTCPVGGTQYDSYVHTPTSKKNFLIVPVWTGSAYVLV